MCELPWAQSAVVSLGAVPLVCSLLEDYWDVPPVVNAVACTLANFARTNEPSFRCGTVGVVALDTARISV